MKRRKRREKRGYTYQNQLENADLWYKWAVSYHEASILLLEHRKDINDAGNAFKIFLFNAALSLELIFKSILATKGEPIEKIHVLRTLCEAAGVQLKDHQKDTLDFLSEIITWLGRYPVPKKNSSWDYFHDNIFERQIDRSTGQALAKRDRIANMENYRKIWSVCQNSYSIIRRIKGLADKFREAILKCDSTELPLSLAYFPTDSCAEASILLGTYFKENGINGFLLIKGRRGEGDSLETHYWLEKDDMLVDITADQFKEVKKQIVITEADSEFYVSFVKSTQHEADYRIVAAKDDRSRLEAVYDYILETGKIRC